MSKTAKEFWQTTALEDMSEAQWESLCDGCGKCCLVKLQDEDTDEVVYTDVACSLLNEDTCRCANYENRLTLVADCVKLTVDNIAQLKYMPPSCAYRLLHEGKDLPAWHPLRTGSPEAMRAASMSVQGRVLHEANFGGDLEARVVSWPLDFSTS